MSKCNSAAGPGCSFPTLDWLWDLPWCSQTRGVWRKKPPMPALSGAAPMEQTDLPHSLLDQLCFTTKSSDGWDSSSPKHPFPPLPYLFLSIGVALQLPSSHPPFPSPLICPTAHHFPDLSVQVLSPSTTHTTTAILSSELHGDSPTDLQSPRFPLCSHLPPGHADPATKCQLPEYPLVMLPKTIAAVVGLRVLWVSSSPRAWTVSPKGRKHGGV